MITRIYVLESIPKNEIQTGTELYNDTISKYCKYYAPSLFHSFETINSKQELLQSLVAIEKQVSLDDEIVLHIEAHGAVDCMQLSNGDLVSWEEFERYLVPINLKTRNKLHLNIVTCYGMHVAERIGKGLGGTAPYKSFTAVKELLMPKEIIHDNTLLYEELIKQREMYKAFIAFNKSSPDTKMRVKDIELVLEVVVRSQVERFLLFPIPFDVVGFYNVSYNLKMSNVDFAVFETIEEKSKYVFESLGTKYFPDRW